MIFTKFVCAEMVHLSLQMELAQNALPKCLCSMTNASVFSTTSNRVLVFAKDALDKQMDRNVKGIFFEHENGVINLFCCN